MEQGLEISERQFDDLGTLVGTFIVSFMLSLIGTLYSTTFLSVGWLANQRTGNVVHIHHLILSLLC